MENYYVGDYRKDALEGAYKGYIVGTFVKEANKHSDDVEVKYWEYQKGEQVKDYLKTSSTIEVTIILSGATKCAIGESEIVLRAGDYIVIQPGVPNNTVAEILEDVEALTIKAPSDPSAKKIVK